MTFPEAMCLANAGARVRRQHWGPGTFLQSRGDVLKWSELYDPDQSQPVSVMSGDGENVDPYGLSYEDIQADDWCHA